MRTGSGCGATGKRTALAGMIRMGRAQDRLKMNQRFAKRNNKHHFYLLRSLLVCATCGYTLQGRFQKGRVYYYCEQGGKHRYPDVERHTCSIAGRIIEPLV